MKLFPVSPNLNAFVERFIQTIQQECLDYSMVVGKNHLDHVVSQFFRYYHDIHPHQFLDTVGMRPRARSSLEGDWAGAGGKRRSFRAAFNSPVWSCVNLISRK